MLEGDNEFAKYLVYELNLHFGSQLLVQTILLHNQVEVIVEGITHSILYLFSKLRVQIVWLIRKLDTLHPQVHFGHASIQQVIELSSCIEKA